MKKRLAALIAVGTLVLVMGCSEAVTANATPITVWKSPTCGCCNAWIDHLREAGFLVTALDRDDMETVKAKHGVPGALRSCHTAEVGGYVVEGHVPASDIARLLEERPEVTGLAVPKMPIGSPGMEGPNPEAYDVLAFETGGSSWVYTSHQP